MEIRKIAVVLLSGGMDSTLCAAIAKNNGYDIAALHLNYRHRTEERELKSFNDLADFYCAKHRLVVDVNYFSQIGGSSLTDNTIPVPAATFDKENIPNTYVPFRNANILAIATSWAEVIGADSIFIGAVQDDSSGYPDCRSDFFAAFQKAVKLGTKPETNIEIHTPVIFYSKRMIVEQCIVLGVPLHLTWSCYQNSDLACGKCESCLLRLSGFAKAGHTDPIKYEV